MTPIVKYKKLDARAVVPQYATPGAAAADLCAVLDTPLTLAPMQRALVPTGLAIELPGPRASPLSTPAAACPSSTVSAWRTASVSLTATTAVSCACRW